MPRPTIFDKRSLIPIMLGCATLSLNLLCRYVAGEQFLPLGNVFLFWCAQTCGFMGTATAIAFGVIPELLLTNDHIYGIRVVSITFGILVLIGRFPGLPQLFIPALLWTAVLGPLFSILESIGFTGENFAVPNLVLLALGDLVVSSISGTTLLIPNVWATLTNHPRHTSGKSIVFHVSTFHFISASFLMAAVAWKIAPNGPAALLNGWQSAAIVGAVLVGLCAALAGGWWFANYFSSHAEEFASRNLLGNTQHKGFSGLASEYWRRQSPSSLPAEVQAHLNHEKEEKNIPGNMGLCAVHKNGTISYINPLFQSLAEFKDYEPLGRNIRGITMRPEIKEAVLSLLDRNPEFGPKTIELKLNQLPDKLRFFEIVSRSADSFDHVEPGESPEMTIITLQDITDRRAIEENMLHGQRLDALGNMMRGIAHSFNNVLTTITGQASAGQIAADPEQIKLSLSHVQQAAGEAGTLVRQLVEFADNKPTLFQTDSLNGILKKRMPLFKSIVGEQIDISFNTDAEQIFVSCDPNLITQAVTNVLINSKEAMPDSRGTVRIHLETEQFAPEMADLIPGARPGLFARLRIEDTGSGMNAEVLSKACDPLFTTKSATGNTGLGLSIVYGILRAHDGFITIEAHPARGSAVTLYLPVVEVKEDAPRISRPFSREELAYMPQSLGEERILVVEDDHHVRDVVASMLRTLGYHVTSCASADEALEKSCSKQFDLILVDMVMPKMSGLDLINELRQRENNTHALMMTAYGVMENNSAGVKVIPKPFDIGTLAHAIRDSLEAGGDTESESV